MEAREKFTICYNNAKYRIEINKELPFGNFKYMIYKSTGVKPHMQEFNNVNLKGREITNHTKIKELPLEKDAVLILTSVPDSSNTDQPNTSKETSDVKPDLDRVLLRQKSDCGMKMLNFHREFKKLLVLDVDETLIDARMMNRTFKHLALRPHLHEFLTTMYKYYDIAFWSATAMAVLLDKVLKMGVRNTHDYKIMCCLSVDAMQTTCAPGAGGNIMTKALHYIWERLNQYNRTNTVICDNVATNFCLNKENGILVSSYSYVNYTTDTELKKLMAYLTHLALNCNNFSRVNHTSWHLYEEKEKPAN